MEKPGQKERAGLTETIGILRKCATNEKCETVECAYFLNPDELMELLEFAEKALDDEDADG